jgi:sigma-B regulation protein RsbU (phosphoserine phosphatase)
MEVEGTQLLVVDVAGSLRDSLARNLEGLGYAVSFADNDEQALDLLGSRGYALVILNVESRATNVYQVLKRLKTEDVSRQKPILVISSSERIESGARCIDLGADDVVTPPLHPTVLRARITSCLDRHRMQSLIERATRERERIVRYERDVQIGRRIQTYFLPDTLIQPDGWEVAAQFQPARQVAGDWYDAFLLPRSNRIGLVIADVCDKGVGAALFMGLMRSLIRAFAQSPSTLRWLDTLGNDAPPDPRERAAERRRELPKAGTTALKNAIEFTNNYIANTHGQTGMFATVFFGILDPATGILMYINGGHEAPVIVGPSGIRSRLLPTGPAIGMMPDSDFEIGTTQIEPGEVIVTYTDGVPEARDPNRKFFTEARLFSLLESPAPTAAALLDRIVDNVRAHIADADQFDDITLLSIRRLPAF